MTEKIINTLAKLNEKLARVNLVSKIRNGQREYKNKEATVIEKSGNSNQYLDIFYIDSSRQTRVSILEPPIGLAIAILNELHCENGGCPFISFNDIQIETISFNSDFRVSSNISEQLNKRKLVFTEFVKFINCSIKNLHVFYADTDFNFNFRNPYTIEISEPNHTFIQNVYFLRNKGPISITNLKCDLLILSNGDKIKIKNPEIDSIIHEEISLNTQLDVFGYKAKKLSKDCLNLIMECGQLENAFDTTRYLMDKSYSFQNNKSIVEYNYELILSYKERPSPISFCRLFLLSYHENYTSIYKPLLSFFTLLFISMTLISCFNLNSTSLQPTKYVGFLLENLNFKNDFSWIKLASIPLNILTGYSLFCFGAALRKRLGFKKP